MNKESENDLQKKLYEALEAITALQGLLDDLAAQAIEAQELADNITGKATTMKVICAECGKEWSTSRYHRLKGNQYICPVCEERMWAKARHKQKNERRKNNDNRNHESRE